MKFFAKIRWVASILLVFFIVLITNLIDRDNFNRLSHSVTTMYEDRVVASHILFDLSNLVHQNELMLSSADSLNHNLLDISFFKGVDTLVEKYSTTKLTQKETLVFDQLKDELIQLQKLESQLTTLNKNEILNSFKNIKHQLSELSDIQLKEGKRQLHLSNKAKNMINLFTQGEIIFLILMAVLVQIVILYRSKK